MTLHGRDSQDEAAAQARDADLCSDRDRARSAPGCVRRRRILAGIRRSGDTARDRSPYGNAQFAANDVADRLATAFAHPLSFADADSNIIAYAAAFAHTNRIANTDRFTDDHPIAESDANAHAEANAKSIAEPVTDSDSQSESYAIADSNAACRSGHHQTGGDDLSRPRRQR